ncbi:MAG: hypothetical protein HZB59_10855 [Ignavibacteriales bacterium]|nr:hypothetical protein [Ignavibacteriales bacterium]
MIAVIGTLGLLMIVVIIGKHIRQHHWRQHILIVIIAMLQVAVVVYVMYSLQIPDATFLR